MPKIVNLGEFLKTWSVRSNSVTRQVTFNRTKIGGKCQNWISKMRHFEWFLNTVRVSKQVWNWLMQCSEASKFAFILFKTCLGHLVSNNVIQNKFMINQYGFNVTSLLAFFPTVFEVCVKRKWHERRIFKCISTMTQFFFVKVCRVRRSHAAEEQSKNVSLW